MKTKKLSILLAAVILLTAASTQAREKPEISNTRMASCLVKVTADPAVLPLNFETVSYLLHSSGVAGKAVREILDISLLDDESEDLFDIGVVPLSSVAAPPKPTESVDIKASPPRAFTRRPRVAGRGRPSETKTEEKETEFYPMYFRRRRAMAAVPAPISAAPAPISGAEQTLFFRLEVKLEVEENVKPVAEEFLSALNQNLRETLLRAFIQHRERLTDQFRLAEEEARRAESALSSWQDQLRAISGSYDLSRQGILDDIRDLRAAEAETSLETELNALKAQAITKRIAETELKVKERLEKDPVTTELQAIVEMYAKQLAAIEKQGGSRDEAMRNLAKARIELAERREKIRISAGGDLIDSLNRDLAKPSLEMLQASVRLNHIHEQLHQAKQLLERADQYERDSLKTGLAKQNLEEVTLLRDRMKRKIRLLQAPTVTVLGAD